MRLATLQFESKLLKCIRMGINIFKIFIWGGILSDICLEIMLRLCSHATVKLNFRQYIGRYTSPNETFEYSCPLRYISTIQIRASVSHTCFQEAFPASCLRYILLYVNIDITMGKTHKPCCGIIHVVHIVIYKQ